MDDLGGRHVLFCPVLRLSDVFHLLATAQTEETVLVTTLAGADVLFATPVGDSAQIALEGAPLTPLSLSALASSPRTRRLLFPPGSAHGQLAGGMGVASSPPPRLPGSGGSAAELSLRETPREGELHTQARGVKEAEGAAALLRACTAGDCAAVTALLRGEGGGGLGVSDHDGDHGGTALHALAGAQCTSGSVADAVRALLHAGAEVNARSANGATALHWAAGAGNLDAVAVLLECGADPLATTYTWRRQVFGRGSGQTPLHWAAESDCVGAVEALTRANPLTAVAQDERGRTARDAALGEVAMGAVKALELVESQQWVVLSVTRVASVARWYEAEAGGGSLIPAAPLG